MRLSTALLADTPVRLSELSFPRNRVFLDRTRLAWIHLDNLLHFAKADRDGQVDGYVAVYLPDEVTLLLLREGELATVISYTEEGRTVRPIPSALKHIREEGERGELIYCGAPLEQLAWMYSGCVSPPKPRPVDAGQPAQFLPALMHEEFTGVLELISNGRVNYMRFEGGVYRSGHFHDDLNNQTVQQYVQQLFRPGEDGNPPQIAASAYPAADKLPEQASPALLRTYREIFWSIANVAESKARGEGMKRVNRVRELQSNVHTSLSAIGTPLESEPPDLVATPEDLMRALSDWALMFLEELETVKPEIATLVLQQATRDHRFVLQKAGFYDRLPWTVTW